VLPLVGQFEYTPRCYIRATPLLSHLQYTPFLHRLFLAIVYKYDVIRETRSRLTYRITTPPQKDQAAAICNMQNWQRLDRLFRKYAPGDLDRQTQTDKQTDTFITILRSQRSQSRSHEAIEC